MTHGRAQLVQRNQGQTVSKFELKHLNYSVSEVEEAVVAVVEVVVVE